MDRLRAWRGWLGLSVLGLALAVGSPGCGGKAGDGTDSAKPNVESGGKPRFVLVTNSVSDYWTAAELGMKQAANELGVDVEMKRNNDATTESQIRLLEEALSATDVKGVAVSVVEAGAPGIADILRKIKEAGKPVVTVDSDVDASAADVRKAYIGTNNAKAGEVAGKAAATIRPQGGQVVVFVGTESASNALERRDGFYQGAGAKFIKPALEVFQDGADKNLAQTNVQTAITKHPDAGIFLGLYSYNGPRIAEEVSKAPDFRKKTTIVTFDLDEQLIAHLEKGDIDVTVVQDPYMIGYEAIRLLKAYAADDKKMIDKMLPDGATSLDTGVKLIVPNDDSPVKGPNVMNIKQMKDWLATKGLKSS